MSMFELTAVLWRRRNLAFGIAAAIFVIGTIAVLSARTTTYTASSEVLFDQPGLVVGQGGSDVPNKINNLLPTFCRFVSSDQVAYAAGAAANVSPAVAASVSCTPETSTLIALLQFKGSNPTAADKVVTSVSNQLVAEIQKRYDQESVPPALRLTAQVIQSSHASRDSNGTLRSLGLVAVGAIVVAAAFALAAEPHRRDWTPPTPAYVEEPVGASVRRN